MFLQPARSWRQHVNFIHPAAPTLGRVFSFLPSVAARSVVVFNAVLADGAWWANMARVGGLGVRSVRRVYGFVVVALDHSNLRSTPPRHTAHNTTP